MNTNKQKKTGPKSKSQSGKDIGLELRKHHFVLGNYCTKIYL